LNLTDKRDPILWSEKVYHTAYEYLVEVEEKTLVDAELLNKTASQRVSDKLKSNSVCTEFNLNGLYPPEIITIAFLLENIPSLELILSEIYQSGSVCCFPTNNSTKKARTLFYFVNKANHQTKLSGMSTTPGDKMHEITLDDKIFHHLQYKGEIIDGYYETDGNSLKAFFTLKNGEKKIEIMPL